MRLGLSKLAEENIDAQDAALYDMARYLCLMTPSHARACVGVGETDAWFRPIMLERLAKPLVRAVESQLQAKVRSARLEGLLHSTLACTINAEKVNKSTGVDYPSEAELKECHEFAHSIFVEYGALLLMAQRSDGLEPTKQPTVCFRLNGEVSQVPLGLACSVFLCATLCRHMCSVHGYIQGLERLAATGDDFDAPIKALADLKATMANAFLAMEMFSESVELVDMETKKLRLRKQKKHRP